MDDKEKFLSDLRWMSQAYDLLANAIADSNPDVDCEAVAELVEHSEPKLQDIMSRFFGDGKANHVGG